MKIGYYPGCSQEGTAKEYNKSLREIFKILDVNLEEIDDWSCCGATSAHVTNHKLSLALSARNLALAEKQGLKEIFAPCAACYNRLVISKKELQNHPEQKSEIENIVEEKINNIPEIFNIVNFFQKIGKEKITEKRKIELKNFKVACYYGCLLVRPNGINSDDSEQPVSMEGIVKATGAQTIDWNFKLECCGAAHSIAKKDIVVDLSKKILDDAKKNGANVVVVACPLCHTNLDMRQKNIRSKFEGYKEIPVLYLSEIIGLSLGLSKKELGIDLHFIEFNLPVKNIVQEEVAQ
jgi:heterodisulfide reductase subunit B2